MADPVTITLAALAGTALGAAPALLKSPKDDSEKKAKKRAQRALAAERERAERSRTILTSNPSGQSLVGEQTSGRTILGA